MDLDMGLMGLPELGSPTMGPSQAVTDLTLLDPATGVGG